MKRFIYFVFCVLTCAVFLTACGDDEISENDVAVLSETPNEEQDIPDEDINIDNNHEEATTETENTPAEVPVTNDVPDIDTDEEEEDSDSNEGSNLTDAQENVAQNPEKEFHASGTFNGFIDSTSVEITMSDGSYQTFFVSDETVYNRLVKLSESDTEPMIQFIYKSREGQVNPEIIKVN